ncbi:MAG: hypothetical protein CSB55_00535 [Candidatus Cloacimonadota bacterium]|nr:MAG: hypothetical protein CSB55_00535 [Candidatus Cloacimonadota bacterium]
MQNKLFYLIIALMLMIHGFVLSFRFFSKEKDVVTVSANKKMRLHKVFMKKKTKKKKKKIVRDISKIAMPVPSLAPVEFEEFFEDEEEDDEVYELTFDVGDDIVYTDYEEGLSEEEISAKRQAYIDIIYYEVNKHKKYPKVAKRLNQEGTAEILFTVLKDGSISDVKISKSSNFIAIDNAALKAVKSVKKLSPIPDELEKDRWDIVLPIKYELFR